MMALNLFYQPMHRSLSFIVYILNNIRVFGLLKQCSIIASWSHIVLDLSSINKGITTLKPSTPSMMDRVWTDLLVLYTYRQVLSNNTAVVRRPYRREQILRRRRRRKTGGDDNDDDDDYYIITNIKHNKAPTKTTLGHTTMLLWYWIHHGCLLSIKHACLTFSCLLGP